MSNAGVELMECRGCFNSAYMCISQVLNLKQNGIWSIQVTILVECIKYAIGLNIDMHVRPHE